GRERVRPLAWCSRPRNSAALLEGASAPSSNTCRLLARDHAAPEPTLALAKAVSLGRERVRPLAWCSRPRNSAALLEGALVSYRVRGTYLESCNCDAPCPCRRIDGRPGGRSTLGICDGALSWSIEEGSADDIELSGLGVVLAARYSDDEKGSPWTFALFVDERG